MAAEGGGMPCQRAHSNRLSSCQISAKTTPLSVRRLFLQLTQYPVRYTPTNHHGFIGAKMKFSRRDFVKSLGTGAGALAALNASGCGSSSSAYSDAAPLWAADAVRNKIVVISDIHLGIEDRYTETLKNRPLLIKFLQCLQNTKDVRELVIAGDFLDEWFLPVYYYPLYTDQDQFYRNVIANNQGVIDELNRVIASGIKLVYVPGNHDLTLKPSVLQEAIPQLVQAGSAEPQGLGTYYTGDRNEIVIEHGHRYDVFSAPDTVTNEALCGNQGKTILPAGYFYARYAATWVLEGKPKVAQNLPVISPGDYAGLKDSAYPDQAGAYAYYSILENISKKMTPYESGEDHFATNKIFKIRISGFNGDYTYKDFFPAMLTDDQTGKKYISAPKLFRNIQLSWQARQVANKVKVPEAPFAVSVAGAVPPAFPDSFFSRAKANYLENPNEKNVEVVVFGHTHVPMCRYVDGGKCYLNSGTWIDENGEHPATRTFVVITTGSTGKDATAIRQFVKEGEVVDITASVTA